MLWIIGGMSRGKSQACCNTLDYWRALSPNYVAGGVVLKVVSSTKVKLASLQRLLSLLEM